MNSLKSLLLIWKNKKNNMYYHVGTLSYDGDLYTFEYTHKSKSMRNVNLAIEQGYSLHPAFPYLEKVYEASHLFEAFNRRIPGRSRVGYQHIVKEFGLTEAADRMDILRATRGVLANDPYTFEPPLRLDDSRLTGSFFVNGMRHLEKSKDIWMSHVSKGDSLKLELEPANKADPYAIMVLAKDNLHIGYVPGIYNQALHALLMRGVAVTLIAKQMRPAFVPQWWLEIEFEARINQEDAASIEESVLFHVLQRVA